MMFRDMMKSVCGACCAAVVMCGITGIVVSEVEGMRPKLTIEEREPINKKIGELVRQVSDMEKMKELLDFLCDPKTDEGFVAFASMSFTHTVSTTKEQDAEHWRKDRLFCDLQNCKRYYLDRPASFFLDKYNAGVYGEDWEPKERDYF
ncbi:MAG: hypothetical protein LBJ96_00715 [Holosporaceae bacterium]|jgi:hypothetical protein|nr:hypothetical protein [Holosporaceae bacterium]